MQLVIFVCEITGCSRKDECMIRPVRSTWNSVSKQATLTHGCGSEAHMNMDVNLRWLPEQIITISEFLVLLTGHYVAFGFREHPVISITQ